jgi:hypothetical protein
MLQRRLKQAVYRKDCDKLYTLLQGFISLLIIGLRIWEELPRPRNRSLVLGTGRELYVH